MLSTAFTLQHTPVHTSQHARPSIYIFVVYTPQHIPTQHISEYTLQHEQPSVYISTSHVLNTIPDYESQYARHIITSQHSHRNKHMLTFTSRHTFPIIYNQGQILLMPAYTFQHEYLSINIQANRYQLKHPSIHIKHLQTSINITAYKYQHAYIHGCTFQYKNLCTQKCT